MTKEGLANERHTALAHMKNPVRLVLFTRDVGCETCPEARKLVRAIRTHSPKIALEEYDMVMDRDKTSQYDIKMVPAIVVQGGEGHAVTFSGLLEDVFLEVLFDTILAVSEKKVWFPEKIRSTLKYLSRDVKIQVYVESDCPQCRPVAETAIGLALENKIIYTDIVIASDFPELIRKYDIKTLPKTIFGENLHMDGHVTESEFLEMIFKAEGLQPSKGRRCLTCGKPSPDLICTECKTRIQAEAVEHKRKTEKTMK
ncbi:MAG TPA: thioredoxin family protein [Nitrospirota bacterium]|nr:thioredoxin family protein [Nitrospirota bacterium]